MTCKVWIPFGIFRTCCILLAQIANFPVFFIGETDRCVQISEGHTTFESQIFDYLSLFLVHFLLKVTNLADKCQVNSDIW